MSSMSIDGLISGFNTTEIVTQLMEIERQPLVLLNQKVDTLNAEKEAWRELNTKLYSLQDAAYDLQSLSMFRGRTVSVSDESVLTATSSDNATVTSYDITVSKLAAAHSVTSDSQTSADTTLNLDGTVQINGQSITISTDDTLNTIADKINDTADVGVYASVVKIADGDYRLTLTSKETGTANAITFVDGGAGAGVLTDLGILNLDDTIKNETQAAADSEIKVNGLTVTRSSNIVDDVIEGVTLTLKSQGSVDLTIDTDKDQIVDAVKKFVEEYNNVMEYISQNSTYDQDTGSKGPLFGESTLTYIQSKLKGYLSETVGGVAEEVNQLALLGISTTSGVEGAKAGTLEFDEETFRSRLDSHFEDIATVFGATSSDPNVGIFYKMYNDLYDITSTGGILKDKTEFVQSEIDYLEDRIDDMELRLAKTEEYYYKKFYAMEQALAKMQNQASWLSAQLANL